jgi:phosphoglycolate phosphatase
MRLHAIIFDLDGTLVDTLSDIARHMNAALSELGFPTHPLEAYARFVGNGIRELSRLALPEGARANEAIAEGLARCMEARYAREPVVDTRPYPGVLETLDALASRGVLMTVLTNKPAALAEAVVAKLLETSRFALVEGRRAGGKAKPDPELALGHARALKLAPGEMAVVGDSDVDMLLARAAGMRGIGATWGFRGAEELVRSGADELARAFGDLLGFV